MPVSTAGSPNNTTGSFSPADFVSTFDDTLYDYSADSISQASVLAVRFTIKGMHTMLSESLNFIDEKYWNAITHFVFHGLTIDSTGKAIFGQPLHFRGDDDYEVYKDSVLNDPSTYIPVINNLREHYPHMRVVLSLPPVSDNVYLKKQTQASPMQFLYSLKNLVDTFQLNTIFEIESNMLEAVLRSETEWSYLESLPISFWIYQPTIDPISQNSCEMMWRLFNLGKIDSISLKSYGHLRLTRCPTSHGTYQTLLVHPESALADFKLAYDLISAYVDPSKILMDMDTCGVEFIRNNVHQGFVERFRLVPLKEVRHRKLLGKSTYIENYDSKAGSSMINFAEDRRVISYDNDQVRQQKFDFVFNMNMKGVVLGELVNDVHPSCNQSLFKSYLQRLIEPHAA
jgi:hypothetical protein